LAAPEKVWLVSTVTGEVNAASVAVCKATNHVGEVPASATSKVITTAIGFPVPRFLSELPSYTFVLITADVPVRAWASDRVVCASTIMIDSFT
jgi:hypothetical protein